jgi:DNA replication protein DnaC
MSTPATATLDAEITVHLKELHLPTMRECYQECARVAQQESLSYEQYLLSMVERECEVRQMNRIGRLLRESRLPLEKSLEQFERSRLPRSVSTQIASLVDGTFLDRCENVLAFGNPGSGKTHLLCAIAQELVQRGRRVLFTASSMLVQELLIAKRELKLERLIKRLARYELLVLDDIGYVQQTREEMEVLFTLLAQRYERGSVMITSNLPFSQWERVFKDPTTTAAVIDRLVHHSIILELNVESYRLRHSKDRTGSSTRGEEKEEGKEEGKTEENIN